MEGLLNVALPSLIAGVIAVVVAVLTRNTQREIEGGKQASTETQTLVTGFRELSQEIRQEKKDAQAERDAAEARAARAEAERDTFKRERDEALAEVARLRRKYESE